MTTLAATLPEDDTGIQTKGSIRSQCTFTAVPNSCNNFQPHNWRRDFCVTCYKKMFNHSSHAVRDDEMIRVAIEYNQRGKNAASEIIKAYTPAQGYGNQSAPKTIGGLFLSGFHAVLSKTFLAEQNIGLIVNTAKSLGTFWPAYKRQCDYLTSSDEPIRIIEMNWLDNDVQILDFERICTAICQIHKMRVEEGKSVLVHCAQGKSRSTTLVLAYLMVLNKTNLQDTLSLVKSKRRMAEPNKNFMKRLKLFRKQFSRL